MKFLFVITVIINLLWLIIPYALCENGNRKERSEKTEAVQVFQSNITNKTETSFPVTKRKYNLTFVVLLPGEVADNQNDCILPKTMPVFELAIKKILEPGFLMENFDVTLVSRDTFCSSVYGPLGFLEIRLVRQINAVFGLSCDYVLAPIARYNGVWEIPVITTSGLAKYFDVKNEFVPTLIRMMGGSKGAGQAVLRVLNEFNWTAVSLIYQNSNDRTAGNSLCYFTMGALNELLGPISKTQHGYDGQIDRHNITIALQKVQVNARIVIMCADPPSIRQIMLVAEELNMIDSGEYVFINIELFSRVPHMVAEPWYDKNDTEENNKRARKAYTALLTVTAEQPDDKEYLAFSDEIKRISAEKYNYTFGKNEPISTFVTSFYDAVLLYAYALNDSIQEDPTVLMKPFNGTDMVRRMWNRSFRGITGNVTIDGNGDRISTYSLLDMNPDTGKFEIIAHSLFNHLEYIEGKSIHWAGGRTEPPPDKPVCGYDGSLCPDNSLPGYAILSLILGFTVIIMAIISFLGYHHYKSEVEINSMTWKVNPNEVMRCVSSAKYRGSMHSLAKRGSQITMYSEDMASLPGDRQIFIPVGFYRGCKVAIKKINENNVTLNRAMMLELKRMKDIQHDHLVRFHGACLDPPKCFLLTEYCPKGSLQDILENEQIKLDWMFKLSLMHDIVRGMHFLHQSDIRSHGNLKSSNCVVDSRFVLKITDFGLHKLRKPNKTDDIENCDSYAYWKKKLWTAPELLRMENPPLEGTQKGDVYSFGIIVHEITTRQGPFYLGTEDRSPEEIIHLVKAYPRELSQPFRPQLDETEYDDINNIMVKCWAEDPYERPEFGYLKATIRRINKDNETGNIVDNLLQRMEQYANNLEGLVEERTRDYLEEKKKCEKLLYQLLPQTVAAQLISGQPVIAETYDQVTIYFSDIVGFTSISAESTPMQVVNFLNDLYTCFDSIVENFDVYKVETIGDAYMVVSGLPIRNGNLHAREIARMALALLDAVYKFTIRHRPSDQLKLRIGLHSGPCVAGVVGLKMPRYCLFGDTVNTASRMESNGEALKIHISQSTKELLDLFNTFIIKRRGYVKMKGKGEMLTYWLEGENKPNIKLNSTLNGSYNSINHIDPFSKTHNNNTYNNDDSNSKTEEQSCTENNSEQIIHNLINENPPNVEKQSQQEQQQQQQQQESQNIANTIMASTNNNNNSNNIDISSSSSSSCCNSSNDSCISNTANCDCDTNTSLLNHHHSHQNHHHHHNAIHNSSNYNNEITNSDPITHCNINNHSNSITQNTETVAVAPTATKTTTGAATTTTDSIKRNSANLDYNNIVKSNNIKNIKIKCNSSSCEDNVKSVTQPLLANS